MLDVLINFLLISFLILLLSVGIFSLVHRKNAYVYFWLPAILTTGLWLLKFFFPAFFMGAHGSDAGWVAMEALFIISASLPVVAAFIALCIQRPNFATVSDKQIRSSVLVFLVFHLIVQILCAHKVEIQLLDHRDNPIEGVAFRSEKSKSLLLYPYFPGRGNATTDENGIYSTWLFPYQDLYMADFKKQGYEFWWGEHPKLNFKYRDTTGIFEYHAPLVGRARKMGATTYLFHDTDLEWHLDQPDEYYVYDIFERGFRKLDRDLTRLEYPQTYDLILDGTKTGGNYSIRITPVQQTGSVQILDQYLREAPANGYQREATINIGSGESRTTNLYFISRNPGVYSRMKIEMEASEEQLIFRYDTWTNPYGSRNLEYEPDLPFSLENQFEREAGAALKTGKLPPEPDIPRMIATGKYK